MRRIILMVTAAALMAALAAMSALPAFAQANDNANSVGKSATNANQEGPGAGGKLISSTAKESGGVGEFASSDEFPSSEEEPSFSPEIGIQLTGFTTNSYCVLDVTATNLDPTKSYSVLIIDDFNRHSEDIPLGETSWTVEGWQVYTGWTVSANLYEDDQWLTSDNYTAYSCWNFE